MMVCSSLLISGCTQKNSSIDQNNKPSTETLEQILRKAQTIESVYYEVNVTETVDGKLTLNTTMKIWQETPYMKENASYSYAGVTLNVSYIQRPNGTFQFEPTKNMYVLYQEIVLPQRSTGDVAEDLLNNRSLIILGTETIDGKTTTVIQYTTNQSENSTTMKMWIWNDKGVPLKLLETRIREDMTFTWDYSYHDYLFEDIPDNTFDIS